MQVKEKRSVGETGYADVRLLKDSVRITFEEGEGYDLEKDQWEEGRSGGKYNITLNSQGTKIISVRPLAGTYIVKFHSFGNRKDDIPEPKRWRGGPRRGKTGNTWYQPDRFMFTLNYRVVDTDKKYAGLFINEFLPYCFEKYPGTEFTQVTGARSDINKIERILSIVGFDFMRVEIPFSINVLPWLERHLLTCDKTFMVTINEKGFVDTTAPLPEGLN